MARAVEPFVEPPPASGGGAGWYVVYGIAGAVALGLEVVFFRVIDAVMRGNAYAFGHVLMLYLLLYGAGAAIGSRFVRRATRPDRWFLGLQFAVGVAALVGLLLLVDVSRAAWGWEVCSSGSSPSTATTWASTT